MYHMRQLSIHRVDSKLNFTSAFFGKNLYKQLTLSAMVRPSLSILDPASAIFLAALMTSDVFFSGPFPLGRQQ